MEIDLTPPVVSNIYQRVNAVMAELDYIAKGDKTVNGMYRFVGHDQVTAKVHPLLVKHGIAILPSIEKIEQSGNRTEVHLLVVFINSDCPTDCFTVRFVGYGIDSGDKGPGKAISYAYKYALLKVFCLETGDDPDNDANATYEAKKCLEFDGILPDNLSKKDKAKLNQFLSYSAEMLGKHVEDVKREAVKRPEDFLKHFNNWNPNEESKNEKKS